MGSSGYVSPLNGGATTPTDGSSFSGSGGNPSFPVLTTPGAGVTTWNIPRQGIPTDERSGSYGTAPVFTDSSTLIADLAKLSKAELADLQTQLRLGGLGNVDSTGLIDKATLDAYKQLLTDTAFYAVGGTQQYTPQTLLAEKVAGASAANAAAGTGSALTDPLVAENLAQAALTHHLGRKPTKAEQDQYRSLLAGYSTQANASSTGAAQLAEDFATGTQGRANEAGALNESRFVDVLSSMMRGG